MKRGFCSYVIVLFIHHGEFCRVAEVYISLRLWAVSCERGERRVEKEKREERRGYGDTYQGYLSYPVCTTHLMNHAVFDVKISGLINPFPVPPLHVSDRLEVSECWIVVLVLCWHCSLYFCVSAAVVWRL